MNWGVRIAKDTQKNEGITKVPNRLTAKTIEDARKGKNLADPILDIDAFMEAIGRPTSSLIC